MKKRCLWLLLVPILVFSFVIPYQGQAQGTRPSQATNAPLKSETTYNITRPDDFFFLFNSTGNTITWVVKSLIVLNPVYDIYYNGIWNASGTWKSGYPVSVSIDGLGIGNYNVTIIAGDDAGGSIQDTVFVFVVENGLPILSRPGDVHCTTDERASLVISWTITDLTTAGTQTYIIRVDDDIVISGKWISLDTVTFPLELVPRGNHTVTIIVTDGSGHSVMDDVQVTVVFPSNSPPVLVSPGNPTIVTGNLGSKVSWRVFDHVLDVATFNITRDGQVVVTGAWVSGMELSVDVSELPPGTYDLACTVHDGLGETTTSLVRLTVDDRTIIEKTTAFFVNNIQWFILGGIVVSFLLLHKALSAVMRKIRAMSDRKKARDHSRQVVVKTPKEPRFGHKASTGTRGETP